MLYNTFKRKKLYVFLHTPKFNSPSPSLDIFVSLMFQHCKQCLKQHLCTSVSGVIVSLGWSARNGLARYKRLWAFTLSVNCILILLPDSTAQPVPSLWLSVQVKVPRMPQSVLLPSLLAFKQLSSWGMTWNSNILLVPQDLPEICFFEGFFSAKIQMQAIPFIISGNRNTHFSSDAM